MKKLTDEEVEELRRQLKRAHEEANRRLGKSK